jgi:hypothetical protein
VAGSKAALGAGKGACAAPSAFCRRKPLKRIENIERNGLDFPSIRLDFPSGGFDGVSPPAWRMLPRAWILFHQK